MIGVAPKILHELLNASILKVSTPIVFGRFPLHNEATVTLLFFDNFAIVPAGPNASSSG